jgi:tRNA G18 (ribose-2'-O)-methylase SpoU
VLSDVVFPVQCILLLGKEKEGIPADLLNLVDICVEIPQYGLTRSLNVHVSAAITLWEITKSNKKLLRSL